VIFMQPNHSSAAAGIRPLPIHNGTPNAILSSGMRSDPDVGVCGPFVLQGFGVTGERTRQGRRLGLGRGWRGRVFAVLVAAGPAFWLFPPSFVRNIILQMLPVIGAS
jgi:hypothetical protein